MPSIVTSPANGTISGADVNLQISCLSLMKTSVATGGFMPSTKAMTFTFSGPVTGCVLDGTPGGPPYNAGIASGSPGVTYSGKNAVIAPSPLPWSFGALTFPLQVVFTLNGCADAVAAANNGATLSVTIKMMDGDVYFVSDTSGDDSNSCLDPSVSCKTIQTGVNQCSAGNICSVFVEGGNYIISGTVSPIMLTSSGGAVRLLGSFDPTFTTQNMDLTPSRIIDSRTAAQCAGSTLGTNECAPITITASGMSGDTTKAHVVQGFAIIADETKKFSFGIRILNGDMNSFSYIFGNYITGGEGGLGVENADAGGIRGGIYILNSKANNQIDTNVLKGGFGADTSYGVYNYDSTAFLIRNRISGDKGFTSSAVGITSYNDPVVAIINNTMNYRQYTDGSVTSTYTYGVYSYENSPNTKYYIAGNTIYSSGASGGSNYGMFMSGSGTNAQMDNNLIMAQGANGVCATFDNTPSSTATFRGNNLSCAAGTKIFVASGSTNFSVFCGDGTFNISGLCLVTNAFMNDLITATRSNQNFTSIPSLAGYPVAQPWLALNTANGGPCTIAFGGVETSGYLNSFDANYKLDAVIGAPVTRTSSAGGTTPAGSAGYSIGAFELDDSSCF